MKAIICGALLALTVMPVLAAEEDTDSANYMVPAQSWSTLR